jgi:hypothetical protein
VNIRNMDAPLLIEDYERHAGRPPTPATPPEAPPRRGPGRPRRDHASIPPASPVAPRRRLGRPTKS